MRWAYPLITGTYLFWKQFRNFFKKRLFKSWSSHLCIGIASQITGNRNWVSIPRVKIAEFWSRSFWRRRLGWCFPPPWGIPHKSPPSNTRSAKKHSRSRFWRRFSEIGESSHCCRPTEYVLQWPVNTMGHHLILRCRKSISLYNAMKNAIPIPEARAFHDSPLKSSAQEIPGSVFMRDNSLS